MAVDLFSLVMRVKAEGAAQAMADLRGIDAAGKQAALGATNFANAWQGALLQFKGSAAQIAGFKEQFSRGFFDEKLIAGMSLAGQEGRRASEGAAAWSRGLANIRAQNEAAAAAMQKKAGAAGLLTSALRPMIALYAGFSLFRFVKETIDGAGALHELSQRTGASVQMLSVLRFAGAQSGVTTEMLAAGFRGLALSMGRLRDGSAQSVEAFARVGLSARDLQGLTVDQTFHKIVEKLALMPDGLEKAEAAQRIFGRGGAAMLPLLEDLAERGYGAVAREAEKMGAVIDANAAKKADAFGDAITRLKIAFGGLLRETLMPILPALTVFVNLLASAVKHLKTLGTGGVANFGFQVGKELAGGGAAEGLADPGGAVARDENPALAALGPLVIPPPPSDADVRAAAREAAAKRKLYQDEVLRLANMDESMRPAGRLDFQGFPSRIATRNDRIGVGDSLLGKGTPQAATAFDQFEARVTAQAARVQREFSQLGQNLGMTLANGFSSAMSAAMQGKNPFAAFGKAVLAGLGSIFVQMGAELIAYGVIMLNLLPFLSNPFTSGPAAIAAGAALVAIGTVLGSIATGSGSKGGGAGGGGPVDKTTHITLTADGLGGRNAPNRPDERFTVLGVDSPKGQRVLATAMKGAKRRNMG
jgi:hypothetical protein